MPDSVSLLSFWACRTRIIFSLHHFSTPCSTQWHHTSFSFSLVTSWALQGFELIFLLVNYLHLSCHLYLFPLPWPFLSPHHITFSSKLTLHLHPSSTSAHFSFSVPFNVTSSLRGMIGCFGDGGHRDWWQQKAEGSLPSCVVSSLTDSLSIIDRLL